MKLALTLISMLLVACGGKQSEPEAPSATAVEVPAAADAGTTSAEPPPRSASPAVEARGEEPVRASVRVEVSNDGGVVMFKSAPDAGVKVWGSTQRIDGGFTFQGGFSFGNADAGP
jgi:hypothetical protein